MSSVRTRFAPSPTGYMHIGNLRTALYEYLIAKSQGGKFILRIEDTDQDRYVEGAVDVIYNTLKLAGIRHDEGPDLGGNYGPYVQSQRKGIYMPYAKQLVDRGHAYHCFCTKERLAEAKEKSEKAGVPYKYDRFCCSLSPEEISSKLDSGIPYVIRQKMPQEGTTTFEDAVYGSISVDNKELEDQILIKSDGLPTYNFANVVDDHLMEITHVVRGSEYLSSAPKYNLLYHAFGWEIPTYVHLPLIVKPDGTKLSKRQGDKSFEDLMAAGYLVEAIMNYVVLLGWCPSDNQEMFTLKELEQAFSIKGISKSPAAFDYDKLNWFNGEYIRKLSVEEFHERAKPYYEGAIKNSGIDLVKVSRILQQRTEILSAIPQKIDFFDQLPEYDNELYIHKKMKTTPENSLESLKAAEEVLQGLKEWNEQTVHDSLMELVQKLGIKNGQMLWPIRTALTGKDVTPGGAIEVADILGKEESLRRIRIGIDKLSGNK